MASRPASRLDCRRSAPSSPRRRRPDELDLIAERDAARAQVVALVEMLERAAAAEDPDEWLRDGLDLIARTRALLPPPEASR